MDDRFAQHLKELDRQRLEALAAARREGVIEGLERAEKIVFAKGFLDSADAISAELERIRRGE